jgi:Na+-translocating ferredoxin:NAD+ oxidoreductase RNF subunit RnfB
MTESVYNKLQRHLDTFLLRAPESDALIEILKIRFTPEEAEVALLLKQLPKIFSEIAQSTRMEDAKLQSVLETMADKALVFKQAKTIDGVNQAVYSLLPTAVGLWETSFAKGEKTPEKERLAHHWREYYKKGWGRAMFTSGVPFSRVIPVTRSVKSEQQVYPYEQAAKLIKQQGYACVLHCPCRKAAELDGSGCGKPTEVCMHFGNLAKFFVEKGYAKEISLEEALDILDMTEKAGLIHMVGNSKEMGVAMCSCCTCCCTQFSAIKAMQVEEPVARSRFFAQVDDELCIGCGICEEERCLIEAIAVVDGAARVNAERCIGCGLCVTGCPEEALSLREREGYEEPVDTGMDLMKAFTNKK